MIGTAQNEDAVFRSLM